MTKRKKQAIKHCCNEKDTCPQDNGLCDFACANCGARWNADGSEVSLEAYRG